MDENAHENDSKDKSSKIDSGAQSSKEESPHYEENSNRSNDRGNNKEANTKTKQRMDIIESKDIWSLLNFLATVGMLIATFLLFLVALPQARSAREAAESAKNAVKVAEDNHKLSKEIYESSANESKERFELEKANSQAQIDAMKEQVKLMKEQFEIENRPYFVIEGFAEVIFQPDVAFSLKYAMANHGKYPAIIERTKTCFFTTEGSPNDKEAISYFKKTMDGLKYAGSENNSIISNTPVILTDLYPRNIIINNTYNQVINRTGQLYWGVECIYVDMITEKKYGLVAAFHVVTLNPFVTVNIYTRRFIASN